MAEVYLAVLKGVGGFEKRLVIKKILPIYEDLEEFTQLFQDEARISVSLSHGNIVQVFDFGLHEGEHFIAMEYVDGPDLEKVLISARKHKTTLSFDALLYVATRLAAALEYAHSRTDDRGHSLRLVHRDVSPPNVLLSVDGEVKLTDFGVAKYQQRLSKSRPGVVRGKYAYMSPEQLTGRDLDHRSDIFGLGTVLYEMVTGRNPFLGPTDYQTMEAVVAANPPNPLERRRETPRDLLRIIQRCLAGDVDTRYDRAGEIRRDLAELMFNRGVIDDPRLLQDELYRLFPKQLGRRGHGPVPPPPTTDGSSAAVGIPRMRAGHGVTPVDDWGRKPGDRREPAQLRQEAEDEELSEDDLTIPMVGNADSIPTQPIEPPSATFESPAPIPSPRNTDDDVADPFGALAPLRRVGGPRVRVEVDDGIAESPFVSTDPSMPAHKPGRRGAPADPPPPASDVDESVMANRPTAEWPRPGLPAKATPGQEAPTQPPTEPSEPELEVEQPTPEPSLPEPEVEEPTPEPSLPEPEAEEPTPEPSLPEPVVEETPAPTPDVSPAEEASPEEPPTERPATEQPLPEPAPEEPAPEEPAPEEPAPKEPAPTTPAAPVRRVKPPGATSAAPLAHPEAEGSPWGVIIAAAVICLLIFVFRGPLSSNRGEPIEPPPAPRESAPVEVDEEPPPAPTPAMEEPVSTPATEAGEREDGAEAPPPTPTPRTDGRTSRADIVVETPTPTEAPAAEATPTAEATPSEPTREETPRTEATPAPRVDDPTPSPEPAAATPPPDAQLVPEGHVRLTIHSRPGGAELIVDGEAVGRTPYEIRGEPGKIVEISASLDGYLKTTRMARIPVGDSSQTIELITGLSAPPARLGTVRVESNPPSYVIVDGRQIGRLTPVTLDLEAGSHTIAVVNPDGSWTPPSRTVTVVAGERITVSVNR